MINKQTRISLIILGAFLFTFSCKTQKEVSSPDTNSFISQDKLGNIYLISEMKITKFSSELDTIQTNSIFSNGVISSIDTRNPMQLMLYYKQQQKIVLMDNTLSETNVIKLGFEDWIDLACMSNRDNAFWLYTINTQSLIKTDKNGKITNRFDNIAQLVKRDINPTQLLEYDNQVYLFDPNNGLFVFDLFGNFIKRIGLAGAEVVKFYEKKVFFRLKNAIYSYDLINFDKKLLFSANHHFDDFVINSPEFIFLKDNELVEL